IYAFYSVPREDFLLFYRKKLRRLGLPLLSVSFLFLAVSNLIGTSFAKPWDKFYEIYLYGYAHFWYLQSSLLIFLIVLGLDYVRLLRSRAHWWGVFILSLILLQIKPEISPNIFGVNGLFYLLPFFLIGIFLKRFEVDLPRKILGIGLFLSAGAGGLLIMNWYKVLDVPFSLDREKIPMILVSCILCIVLFGMRMKHRYLSVIGGYSYAIYLYHFAQSGIRIGLETLHLVPPPILLFPICLIAGLVIPVGIQSLLERVPLLAFLFLGKKYQPVRNNPQAALETSSYS
ncbi:MAG: acyltransferase, partial [Rhodospirillales bacterium]|nr:acyltransferase [Rhodospirillales bacterium]